MPAKPKPELRSDVIYDALAILPALTNNPCRDQNFSSNEVIRFFPALTARMLQWWSEQGILFPNVKGHRRSFGFEDLFAVKLILNLRTAGISIQRIRKIAGAIDRCSRAHGRGRYLLLYLEPRVTASLIDDSEDALAFLSACTRIIRVIDLERFTAELDTETRAAFAKTDSRKRAAHYAEKGCHVAGAIARAAAEARTHA